MCKPTPGPWNIRKEPEQTGSDAYNHWYIDPYVANVFYTNDTGKANAALIAAAPDLLAALQDLVENGIGTQSVQVARAAIAKATGGQP